MADDEVIKTTATRSGTFAIGTIVTRDGTDRHRVVNVNPDGDLIEVECVVAAESGWCAVGEREWNLPRRYTRSSL